MKQTNPPKIPLIFFRWFCRPEYLEDLEGDLLETFENNYEKHGIVKARFLFVLDIILLFKVGIIRRFNIGQNLSWYVMMKHNILWTLRRTVRYKSSSIISILSLSIGLFSSILMYLWVQSELQVDKFHASDNRLLQILTNEHTPNGITTSENTPGLLGAALSEEFSEVEYTVTVVPYEWFEGESFMLSDGQDKFFTSRNQFASADFFRMFSFDLKHGEKDNVLSDKKSVVISTELALKLFQTTDALGKSIKWIHDEFGGTYKVSGIFNQPVVRSTIAFDAVFNYSVFLEANEDLKKWSNSDPSTFVTLKSDSYIGQFNQKIKNFLKSKSDHLEDTFFVQLFSERYLFGEYMNGVPSGGRIDYIRLFSTITFFILIVACINFMNINTAQNSSRFKEIGTKKALGIGKSALAVQYLTEAVFIAFFSFILSVLLVALLLPYFELISNTEILLEFDAKSAMILVSITLFSGIVAGSYPAIYLSGIKPVNAFKGITEDSLNGLAIRKGLVVFQLCISAILIISFVIVDRQLELIQNQNLGYTKENVLHFKMGIKESNEQENDNPEIKIERFLQQLKNITGVISTSNYAYFLDDFGTTEDISWSGSGPNSEILFGNIASGYDFIETMQIKLEKGRSYSREFRTDHKKIIFNKEAIEAMNLEDPIGKSVRLWGEDREIIGVTENFHFDRLYEEIGPLFIKLTTSDFASNIMVRIEAENQLETIAKIENLYRGFFGGYPFEFHFFDQDYQKLYESELRIGVMSSYAGVLAILISCLGLFGLSSFVIEQKTKEIGIRKVLGATVMGMIRMLSTNFFKLVLIAFLISTPISYLLMDSWLANFAYRYEITIWPFFAVGISVLLITFLTISSHVIKASLCNPVNSLRNE